jgi:Mrp family chromosome partitioning ATPase
MSTSADGDDPFADEAAAAAEPNPSETQTTSASLTTVPSDWVRSEALEACIEATRRMGGTNLKRVAVTSSIRGEGRSTIAAAIAVIQAFEYERKAILVDFDLDQPSSARRFGLQSAPGVAEAVAGGCSVRDCIQWPAENLGVMVAGRSNGPNAELLRATSAQAILDGLSHIADVVVVDLPPLGLRSSALQLADLCQTQILVVKAGALSVRQVHDSAAKLTTSPYIILNGTRSALPRWARRLFGMSQ